MVTTSAIKQGVISTGTKIKQGVVSTGTKIAEGVRDLTQAAKVGQFSTFSLVFVIAVFITVVVLYYKQIRTWLSPDVLRDRVVVAQAASNKSLSAAMTGRESMETTLSALKSANPADALLFANMYISTVNGTGLFFPARDGVFSPDAVRQAVRAGARCFVLDVWPDMSPTGGFAPILQVVEAGSVWRRISLNSLPLDTAIGALQASIYGGGLVGSAASNKDLVVLYLRFQGKPRKATFDMTASILQKHLESYRLDPSFTVANQKQLYMTRLSALAGKVVVLSNMAATDSGLDDYINGVPKEWSIDSLKALPDSEKTDTRTLICEQLNIVAPPLDTETGAKAEDNFMWGPYGHAMGIQFAAMNFFGDTERDNSLREYIGPDMFGKRSYVLKPADLRMKPATIGQPNVSSGNKALQQTIGTGDITLGSLAGSPRSA
jgi:hypothetical protein